MRVIGTAGHVDHGKSTLVRALTGIDPDRLAEEKARQMTIDLGFAWLMLPGGEQVGIVDVPGHRDFIENMLAGVGGIDAVLFVIAADEGIMPQTREHLAILDLLNIKTGMIALTKCDLIDDADWLALVEAEIREMVQHTALADAPIIPVSAYSGAGLPALLSQLEATLAVLPPHVDTDAPRISIDRVFTMSGFGTVVTGTLLGGSLRVGDDVEIQPIGMRARIRGLQSYRQQVDVARPGSRVAVNLAGVEKQQLKRGFMLAKPGLIQPTQLIDVHFRHMSDAGRPLKHNAEVKVFVGAAETTAHVRLLADETLAPGVESWLQLRLANPIPAARGDRYILRYPSPGQTIGGGVVADPHPARRWRRFQPEVISALEARMQGTPAERIAQAASDHEPIKRAALKQQSGYSDAEFERALEEAIAQRLVHALPDGSYWSVASWNGTLERMRAELAAFHKAEPLRLGMPREELRSRMKLKHQTINWFFEASPELALEGNLVRLADHAIRFTDAQNARIAALREQFTAAPYTPPSYAEAAQKVGEDVLRALIELGDIVQVQNDIIFWRDAYEQMVETALRMIDEQGALVTSSFRDHFATTRKYAIGLLEHLDSAGITKRAGDNRVRGSRRPS